MPYHKVAMNITVIKHPYQAANTVLTKNPWSTTTMMTAMAIYFAPADLIAI
jgi:hypothetical protein